MNVSNAEISRLFLNVADFLELKRENPFRVRAYRNAAEMISHFATPLEYFYSVHHDLPKIQGVGKDLAQKIEEIINTGRLKLHEELKKQIPETLLDIMKIPGLGPVKTRKLWTELGVKDVPTLKKKALDHRISKVSGFGEKSEEKIVESIQLLENSHGRFPWQEVHLASLSLIEYLKGVFPGLQVESAGSYRRGKEDIGDLDLLVVDDHVGDLIAAFQKYTDCESVISSGEKQSTILLSNGMQVDLKLVPPESFGSALVYFTGSKSHNIALRKIAIGKGMRLNEYGLFKGNRKIICKTEKQVYEKLGMVWIPPEMREDRGEIEQSRDGAIPELIQIGNIRGDLHVHTLQSDGVSSIMQMALAAKNRGYEYIAITDHSKNLRVANGLNDDRYLRQFDEIDRINEQLRPFRIFKGGEVDILEDGSLDASDRVLSSMEVVVISVHDHFQLSRNKQTQRMLSAMDHPGLKIIGHPTGKMAGKRKEMNLDFDSIVHHASQSNCHFELNCQPRRMDLNEEKCRLVIEHDAGLVISTDAHRPDEFGFMDYGVKYARRAAVKATDVLNTKSLKMLMKSVHG